MISVRALIPSLAKLFLERSRTLIVLQKFYLLGSSANTKIYAKFFLREHAFICTLVNFGELARRET